MEMMPTEVVEQKIYLIRAQNVMLDRDLANLYGVETRVLNQAVRRNIRRFPEDFMLSLTREEIMDLSRIVTSYRIKQAPFQDAAFIRQNHRALDDARMTAKIWLKTEW